MRSIQSDAEYFAYLDEMRNAGEFNTVLAPVALLSQFPFLRAEEAKAICADWRATYHERHARPARG